MQVADTSATARMQDDANVGSLILSPAVHGSHGWDIGGCPGFLAGANAGYLVSFLVQEEPRGGARGRSGVTRW